MRRFATTVALFVAFFADGTDGQEAPAANMRDVERHFAACFQAPCGEEDSQATFHFSLNRDGQLFGEPRVAWFKFKGSGEDRKRLTGEFLGAFKQCLPIPLSEAMTKTIAGKTFFLQYRIDRHTLGDAVVTLRPY